MNTETENETSMANGTTQRLSNRKLGVLLLVPALFVGSLVALFVGNENMAGYARASTYLGSMLFLCFLGFGISETTCKFDRGVLATETSYGRNLSNFVSKNGRFSLLDWLMIAFVLLSVWLIVQTHSVLPILSRVPTSLIVGLWISCAALVVIYVAVFTIAVWVPSVRKGHALSVAVAICLATTATFFVLTISTLQVGLGIALGAVLLCLYIPIFCVTVGDYPFPKQGSQDDDSGNPSDTESASN